MENIKIGLVEGFPPPLEVHRYLHTADKPEFTVEPNGLPSPLEVDRELYEDVQAGDLPLE